MPEQPPILDVERWSSWGKAKRITAYVIRFLRKRLKGTANSDNPFAQEIQGHLAAEHLTIPELRTAENLLLRLHQAKYPPTEAQARDLSLFLDHNRLLRLNSRLNKSDLTDYAKQPIFLQKATRIAELVTQEAHESNHHAAVNTTTAILRQRFWIPHGKKTVASVLRKTCLKCQGLRAKPYCLPDSPDLPANRVARNRPFAHCGVDYFGPVSVRTEQVINDKTTRGVKKIWVALFTCMVTRAIHLEVAQDNTALMFLHTLRRFIARRGVPNSITSDNGKNFTAAAGTLTQRKEAQQESSMELRSRKKWLETFRSQEVQDYSLNKEIQWRFIPERAAWMGASMKPWSNSSKPP
uniref:Integrase zinc-binding domain-containing protein n=1 Tax=Ditylenchus dipsaci TaxID=166011 RepID=A0A915CW89_9BILA